MSKTRATKPISERFWSKVEKTDGCWNWTGALRGNGYGAIGIGRPGEGMITISAHRLSWMLHNSMAEISPGLLVCHTCDNRKCVRIEHLFLGTSKDNQSDMAFKGRSLRGERHNLVQLNEEQIIDIRLQWAAGGLTQQEIAEQFNTSKANISQIVRGKRWKHLLPDEWTPLAPQKWSRSQ